MIHALYTAARYTGCGIALLWIVSLIGVGIEALRAPLRGPDGQPTDRTGGAR